MIWVACRAMSRRNLIRGIVVSGIGVSRAGRMDTGDGADDGEDQETDGGRY